MDDAIHLVVKFSKAHNIVLDVMQTTLLNRFCHRQLDVCVISLLVAHMIPVFDHPLRVENRALAIRYIALTNSAHHRPVVTTPPPEIIRKPIRLSVGRRVEATTSTQHLRSDILV